jgi:uncharacterized SAM-binding protein YcdF (DUF218 family)
MSEGAAAWLRLFGGIDSMGLLVLLLAVASVLVFARSRWARWWLVGLTLACWFVATPLGSAALSAPLARPFGQIHGAADAGPVGAIVILGAGVVEACAGPVTVAQLGYPSALRTVEGARVFRALGGQPLVIASGGRVPKEQQRSEGEVMAEVLVSLHVPSDHILIEGESLSTRDEAVYVTRMLRERGVHRFVLVTSPVHMRRSVMAFQSEGADVVPSVAVDTSTNVPGWPWFVPNDGSLNASDQAVHDYLGIAYYWVRGWLRP